MGVASKYDSEKIMSSVDENRYLGGDYARPELQRRMGGGNTSFAYKC